MIIDIAAFRLGVAGLRSMTAVAAVSWAAYLGWIIIGAVVGAVAGKRFRASLAVPFGADRPAAFIEDAVAIGCACRMALGLA